MIFERTKHGEVMALARLLNVEEEDLLGEARVWQHGIESLEQINDGTYGKLLEALTLFVKLRAEGRAEVFSDIYDSAEDDELEDEERDFEARWAMEEDDGESLAIQRAIDKGWW